jgi:ribonuclease G
VLAVHPYVHAYFTQGFISKRLKWLMRYKRWVHIEKDTSMGVTEFKFLTREGEEIQLTA